jgi:hypothetical protein
MIQGMAKILEKETGKQRSGNTLCDDGPERRLKKLGKRRSIHCN